MQVQTLVTVFRGRVASSRLVNELAFSDLPVGNPLRGFLSKIQKWKVGLSDVFNAQPFQPPNLIGVYEMSR